MGYLHDYEPSASTDISKSEFLLYYGDLGKKQFAVKVIDPQ